MGMLKRRIGSGFDKHSLEGVYIAGRRICIRKKTVLESTADKDRKWRNARFVHKNVGKT